MAGDCAGPASGGGEMKNDRLWRSVRITGAVICIMIIVLIYATGIAFIATEISEWLAGIIFTITVILMTFFLVYILEG